MRERRSGGARVTSSPRKRMVPEVARSSPESRLSRVDFPAPLGPITACTRPSSKARETPSTAASDPKRRARPTAARSGSGIARAPRLQQPRHAPRQEQNHRDDHRGDQRVPMFGDALAKGLEEGEQKSA